MPSPYNKLELFSVHTVSKGMIGECGLRGGFLEAHNIDENVLAELKSLKKIV